ncbi:hypothetical protein GQ53DRAFT_343481 [Thozetella sp. PMI_491]|nr:hypothetical protein GQ53DRAFT_343481 [Thozetella sp. PMI_491]
MKNKRRVGERDAASSVCVAKIGWPGDEPEAEACHLGVIISRWRCVAGASAGAHARRQRCHQTSLAPGWLGGMVPASAMYVRGKKTESECAQRTPRGRKIDHAETRTSSLHHLVGSQLHARSYDLAPGGQEGEPEGERKRETERRVEEGNLRRSWRTLGPRRPA